jgi:hypothetical protein
MKPNPNRIKGTDYRSWDKFDPESESESTINKTIVNQKKQLEIPQGLSTQERQKLAEFEKIKGNDCMRANEYDQAVTYSNIARILFFCDSITSICCCL